MHDDERGGCNSVTRARDGDAWPLVLVVFGPFVPELHAADLDEDAVFAVDKDAFDDVLRSIVGQVSLDVGHRMAGDPSDNWVRIPIENMRSFHPDAIVQAVPRLRELAELRRSVAAGECGAATLLDRLRTLQVPAGALEYVHEVIGPVGGLMPSASGPGPVESGASGASVLDAMLSASNVPGAARTGDDRAGASDVGRLIGQLSGARRGEGLGPAAIARITSELDRQIGAFVSASLHHPKFRRLEALWRGLKFLVERTDFRAPIRMLIGPSDKEHLAERITRFADGQIPAHGAEADLVIVAACEFDRSPADMQVLRSLAVAGENLAVPVVAGAAPGFLGDRSPAELERLTNLGAIFDEPTYVKWRALREAEESRWLTLVFNRFLARECYGPGGVRTRSFEFDEQAYIRNPDDACLWANPVWLLAERLTARFAETGWATELAGSRNGVVGDLPVRTICDRGPATVRSPVETMLDARQVEDLAHAGVAAWTAQADRDAAVLLAIPTVHRPRRYSDVEQTHLAARRATLPYQMFAARMASLAALVAQRLPGGQHPQTIDEIFRAAFGSLVPSADACDVQVVPAAEADDRYEVSLTILPERVGWPLPPVHLQCRVRR